MTDADGGAPPLGLLQLLNGYQQTCVLIAAFRLGIFDKLSAGAKTCADLAAETGAQPAMLERLVRALVGLRLVKEDDRVLSLPAYIRPILDSWRDVAVLIDTQYLPAWHALAESVVSGEPAFDRVFGTNVWRHREENSEINRAFNSFGRQLRNHRALLDAYDFSRFATIADIGGGHGELVAGILKRHPEVRGMLFDQPHVLEHAKVWIEEAGVATRCTLHSGSFFDNVPAGADLYILQHVLHDWSDEHCRTILRKCREAMGPEGTLLIIEKVVPEENPPLNLIMLDLHMMAVLGGQERTLHEYEKLLSEAGLVVGAFHASPAAARDIIECIVGAARS